MANTNTTSHSLSEIRQDLERAKQQLNALQRERQELPDKIKDTARRDRENKASAARAGEDVNSAGNSDELSELREREKSIPAEVWAAKLRVSELEAEAAEYRLSELRGELPEAHAERERAQAAFREARDLVEKAQQHEASLEQSESGMRKKAKHFREQAAELEKRGPDA